MYKVPRRKVYCETLRSWLRETAWCLFVLKAFRSDIEDMLGHRIGE